MCLDVLATENRTLELHSPDGVHSCVLRASDASEAAAWFNTLHSALCVLNLQALQEANRALGAIVGELQHIGWLARKPATTEVSALLQYYIIIIVVVVVVAVKYSVVLPFESLFFVFLSAYLKNKKTRNGRVRYSATVLAHVEFTHQQMHFFYLKKKH